MSLLLRYASAIMEQTKRWDLLALKFKICATTPKTQQHAKQGVQTESTSDMQQCRVRLQGALSSTRNEKLPDRRLKLAPGLPGDISWEKP